MISRRSVLLAPAAAMAASSSAMKLCLDQTTSTDAGYRRSLEGYAKAGIKYVEIIPPQLEPFAKTEGLRARRTKPESGHKRAQDNLREVGEIVKPYRVVTMLEFMRGSTFVGTLPTSLKLTRDTSHQVHFQDVQKIPRELLDNTTRDIAGDGGSGVTRDPAGLARNGL
jgi:hypothetical protein